MLLFSHLLFDSPQLPIKILHINFDYVLMLMNVLVYNFVCGTVRPLHHRNFLPMKRSSFATRPAVDVVVGLDGVVWVGGEVMVSSSILQIHFLLNFTRLFHNPITII